MKDEQLEQQIREKTLSLLSTRSHSTQELKGKLQKKFPDTQLHIEKIISECLKNKLLDDASFAKEYIRYRQETSPHGKFAIKMELLQKGISGDIISEALGSISEDDEFQNALELTKRKQKTFPHNLPIQKQKEKLFRFLGSRGFDIKIISSILEELLDSEAENS